MRAECSYCKPDNHNKLIYKQIIPSAIQQESIMTRIWELPSGHDPQPKDERRHAERRSPWPTVIYSKSERRRHPDRRKTPR